MKEEEGDKEETDVCMIRSFTFLTLYLLYLYIYCINKYLPLYALLFTMYLVNTVYSKTFEWENFRC